MTNIPRSWAIVSMAGLLLAACTVTTTDDSSDGGTSGTESTGTTGSGTETTGTTGATSDDGGAETTTGTTGTGGSTAGTTGSTGTTPTACCPTVQSACATQITAYCAAFSGCNSALTDYFNCFQMGTGEEDCNSNFLINGMEDGAGAGEADDVITCFTTDNHCDTECQMQGDAGLGGD